MASLHTWCSNFGLSAPIDAVQNSDWDPWDGAEASTRLPAHRCWARSGAIPGPPTSLSPSCSAYSVAGDRRRNRRHVCPDREFTPCATVAPFSWVSPQPLARWSAALLSGSTHNNVNYPVVVQLRSPRPIRSPRCSRGCRSGSGAALLISSATSIGSELLACTSLRARHSLSRYASGASSRVSRALAGQRSSTASSSSAAISERFYALSPHARLPYHARRAPACDCVHRI